MSTENKTHTFAIILQKLQSWRIAPLVKDFVIEAAVPKKVRGKFETGDELEISFVFDYDRF